jgi:2-polyprenyl-3-methyl-5-hydroxy-6-metoxy-1,4-benzoquinol methylase
VIDTLMAAGLCRTLMVASRVGVFEALADGPLSADEVARRLDTHPVATKKLLFALAGTGYVDARGERFDLGPVARRWLLERSERSLRDHMELMFLAWRWLEHYEQYVRTGEPLEVHGELEGDDWRLYQRGMRSLAAISSQEVAWRTPVPRGARDMIDVGGSHGYYSVALCRRHGSLRSTVLDLPEAIAHAAPILAKEGMGDRVAHLEGNALEHDFGEERYDLVLVSNLVHHFDDATNRSLVARIANALRPRGVLVVQEVMRPMSPQAAGGAGALGDLYFGALSEAGTWSPSEIAAWQRDAGLEPLAPLSFLTAPSLGQQSAKKP